MTRDPRTDPRPGDVVETKYGTYHVVQLDGDCMEYRRLIPEYRWSTIDGWADMMRGATIIQRGDDE